MLIIDHFPLIHIIKGKAEPVTTRIKKIIRSIMFVLIEHVLYKMTKT